MHTTTSPYADRMNLISTLAEKIMPLAAWRYALVGLSSTAVDFFVFLIMLHWFELAPLKANAIGFCVAVVNSYIWNRKFVFEDPTNASLKQFLKFIVVACGGLAISSGFIYITSSFLMPELAKFIAIFLTFGWGFLASRKFVFGT